MTGMKDLEVRLDASTEVALHHPQTVAAGAQACVFVAAHDDAMVTEQEGGQVRAHGLYHLDTTVDLHGGGAGVDQDVAGVTDARDHRLPAFEVRLGTAGAGSGLLGARICAMAAPAFAASTTVATTSSTLSGVALARGGFAWPQAAVMINGSSVQSSRCDEIQAEASTKCAIRRSGNNCCFTL